MDRSDEEAKTSSEEASSRGGRFKDRRVKGQVVDVDKHGQTET